MGVCVCVCESYYIYEYPASFNCNLNQGYVQLDGACWAATISCPSNIWQQAGLSEM